MSDGPHRSLPMRRRWQLVAERADKRSYTVAEIRDVLVPALERDCRDEMSPEFIAELRRVAEEPSLFRDDSAARLEALRPLAGSGMGRAILDNVGPLAVVDIEGWSLVRESLKAAVQDRAHCGIRQVEEHFLREATAPRANNVRARLTDGVASADFDALVARVLSAKPTPVPRVPKKQTGLDDGVSLP
jgi:hypothetical protein